MDAKELKSRYIKFFQSKGHTLVENASLIPENDPTVLFTTAGMHPLVPFLLGEKHPKGKRLTSIQRCIRTVDIDEVGDPIHLTFFEMLGNWSLGDYWKKEAIEFSFEFLTKILNIPVEKLAITCFKGDKDAAKDEESARIWQSQGIKKDRIAFLPKEDNWWGPAGDQGPCGPCTEMFYWASKKTTPKKFDPSDKSWVEIGNDVLLEYNKKKSGEYEKAKQRNIDFGGGVERTLAVINGLDDVYLSEIFLPTIKKIEEISNKSYKGNEKSMRIIADHIRTSVFILGDQKGIVPSNLDQGYVLRRLIRRSIRHGINLGIKDNFTKKVAQTVIKIHKDDYPELDKNKELIFKELDLEEEKFRLTLGKGLKEFNKLTEKVKQISGKEAFILFSSYGFPLEMVEELARDKKIKVDIKGFQKEFEKHQELSRIGAEKKFKGGLADASEEVTRLHTATHLLHTALRKVLGNHVQQKGSNITKERLRFDFTHPEKMTNEQIKKVEDIVNDIIKRGLDIKKEFMPLKEAKKKGALAFFTERYKDTDNVSTYTIGDFSMEVCGGPHVKNTRELKHFKIVKEESSSAGIRRIKAVLD
nr:alanine--tRNA ligase [Candidatus Woesearchaeota archaeon]